MEAAASEAEKLGGRPSECLADMEKKRGEVTASCGRVNAFEVDGRVRRSIFPGAVRRAFFSGEPSLL
jgi:hypothetical protein